MQSFGALLGFGFLLSEVGLAYRRNAARAASSRKMDGNSLRVLWIVIAGAITVGVWLAGQGVGPRLSAGVPWGWIGLTVFAAGTVLRWWAIYYLGKFFTVDVAVAVDHRVVNTGPYRWVRHPSYTGLLLQFAGLSLSLGNTLSVAVINLPILLALCYRIQVEEAALRNGLGEEYVAYMRGTKRLVPWVL